MHMYNNMEFRIFVSYIESFLCAWWNSSCIVWSRSPYARKDSSGLYVCSEPCSELFPVSSTAVSRCFLRSTPLSCLKRTSLRVALQPVCKRQYYILFISTHHRFEKICYIYMYNIISSDNNVICIILPCCQCQRSYCCVSIVGNWRHRIIQQT